MGNKKEKIKNKPNLRFQLLVEILLTSESRLFNHSVAIFSFLKQIFMFLGVADYCAYKMEPIFAVSREG